MRSTTGRVAEPELADVAAFLADASHQADRVGAKLVEVAVAVPAGYPFRFRLVTTVVGRDSKPRTLTECTRLAPDSSMS